LRFSFYKITTFGGTDQIFGAKLFPKHQAQYADFQGVAKAIFAIFSTR